MSLILEALKKAEDERRLGQAPTLASVSPWRVQRRTPWQGILLALILVATVGGVLWLTVLRPASKPGADAMRAASASPAATRAPAKPEPTTAATPPAQGIASAGADAPTPARAAAPPAAKPGTPPARVALERAQVEARALSPDERRRFEGGEQIRNNPGLVPPPTPTRERAMPDPDAALPAPLDENAGASPGSAPAIAPPRPERIPPGVQLPPPPAHYAPPPDAATPAEPIAAATPPATSALPELGAADRAALPALKLTLHYFNPDAARRFVLINGERFGEGQDAAPGVRVLEIRPEGVMLEFRGHAFYLPRAGG